MEAEKAERMKEIPFHSFAGRGPSIFPSAKKDRPTSPSTEKTDDEEK